MTRSRIYLDWAATAPLHPAAVAAMADACRRLAEGEWANPSSQHGPGRAARRALEEARATVAAFLGVDPEAVVFTSGATESIELAIRGTPAPARCALATEHPAVLEAMPDALRLPVDAEGRLELAALGGLPASALVAVQQANSETGVVQDLEAVAQAVHAAGGRLLADCAQSAGRLPIPGGADLVAISAHKLGGPMGVGALVVRDRASLVPSRRGGGQEGGLRGGTENLPGILGFAAAVAAFDRDFPSRAAALQVRLEAGAVALGFRVNGAGAPRLPHISSLHLPGMPAATQLIALDLAGIAVSQGSACSSGTLRPSPVLQAMGLGAAARESIRVSIGWATTEADVDRLLDALAPLARRAAA
ncbi:MAG: cysteine desulfurase [Sphingomonadaceae bacterium]|uniref:cysteine desulfurase family protein n=1 Tax=Thermaurantiacus sp. TaxID=2820283 RepID=UPI00298ED26F|nr:cysteine desulfurase family protein [Thermaurantiacus sp.]MCS6986164.1 cysteine desulfurase [Sphingomonadaceae bacterium]MDW8414610.1 cysteine desulfurase family protein [Thermaurantiacus sp.]